MDAYLALISLRVVREYSEREISSQSLNRILQAARATGSSQNRQLWRFIVLRSTEQKGQLAETVFAPANISGCRLVIAIVNSSKSSFDMGRVAQNLMLAAWNEGIGSAPNGARDPETAKRILGMSDEENIGTILSFGYPRRAWTPKAGDEEGILRRIQRKPLEELVAYADEPPV